MRLRTIPTLALLVTLVTACAEGPEREEGEGGGQGVIELPVDLMARATVTVEAARSAASARVPGGEVVAGELEEEDGKLIYSFDLRVAGQDGVEEVHVDALTGEVIAHEHEGADHDDAEGEDAR